MKLIKEYLDWGASKENWLLQNMTKVIIFIITGLWIFYILQMIIINVSEIFRIRLPIYFGGLNFYQLLSFTGFTIAFWYGYKKYERDKEIELVKSLTDLSKSLSFEEAIYKWSTSLKLKNQGYISKDFFELIEFYCSKKFFKYILKIKDKEKIHIEWALTQTLLVFNNNDYIINHLSFRLQNKIIDTETDNIKFLMETIEKYRKIK